MSSELRTVPSHSLKGLIVLGNKLELAETFPPRQNQRLLKETLCPGRKAARVTSAYQHGSQT